MRLGCCTTLARLDAVGRAGFDFAEPRVVDLIPDEDDVEYAPIRRKIQDTGVPVEAFNVFIPAHHPVVGAQRNLAALQDYLAAALGRAAELGARLLVFGSGPARATPAGFDHHLAPGQILEFLSVAGDAATPHEIDIVIEPLWRGKCDNINTILEAACVARQSGSAHVAALADWWHMVHEDEPLTNLAEARDQLRHVHVPVPPLPGSPAQVTDPGLPTFLHELLALNYRGRISVEDNGRRFEAFETQAPQALAYIREQLQG